MRSKTREDFRVRCRDDITVLYRVPIQTMTRADLYAVFFVMLFVQWLKLAHDEIDLFSILIGLLGSATLTAIAYGAARALSGLL